LVLQQYSCGFSLSKVSVLTLDGAKSLREAIKTPSFGCTA